MKARAILAPLLLGAAGLTAWELLCATGGIAPWMLPAPSSIAAHFIQRHDVFLDHTRTTTVEFVLGYSFAAVVGVVWGIFLARFRWLRETSYPYIIVLGALPAAAFAPIANLWFGYDLASKVLVAAVIAVFPVVTSTVSGIHSIPHETVEAAMLDGAGGVQLTWHVLFPLSLPSVLIGLRVAWAGAIIGAITSELFGAVRGLGYAIQFGLRMGRSLDIYVATALLSLLSLAGYFLLRAVEKRFAVTMWVQK